MAQEDNSPEALRLNKIVEKTSSMNFNFYSSNGEKSFILRDNKFHSVPNTFYKMPDPDLIPENSNLPKDKVTKKLIEISRLKNYEVYIKNEKKLFYLTPENTLTPIPPQDYPKYFKEQEKLEEQNKEKQKEEEKKQKEEKENKEKEQAQQKSKVARTGDFLLPGWHKGEFDFAVKGVTIEGTSLYTNYLSFTPYYKMKKYPIALMPWIGGNMLQTTEKTFLSIDFMFNALWFFKVSDMVASAYLGYGRQMWMGMAENNTIYQLGVGLWLPLPFYIHELALIYSQVPRTAPKPGVSEIKFLIGFRFFR